MLITNRQEFDIQITLQYLIDYVIFIEDERIDVDIYMHVERCL